MTQHQQALITWLVAYPVITFLVLILEPLLRNAPLPLRTLILSALMVPLMVYWLMPAATSWFKQRQLT